jgi:large conductance mechanosensitive channel
MPLVSLLLPGNQGYLGWKIVFGQKEVPYGLFFGEVFIFLIVAFALFIFIVKFLGWLMTFKKQESEEKVVEPSPPTKDQELLGEIRDLLKAGCG